MPHLQRHSGSQATTLGIPHQPSVLPNQRSDLTAIAWPDQIQRQGIAQPNDWSLNHGFLSVPPARLDRPRAEVLAGLQVIDWLITRDSLGIQAPYIGRSSEEIGFRGEREDRSIICTDTHHASQCVLGCPP